MSRESKIRCDICDEELERRYFKSSRKPSNQEGSLAGTPTIRRRLVRILLGPAFKFREWTYHNGKSRMKRIDVCTRCRDRIRDGVKQDGTDTE